MAKRKTLTLPESATESYLTAQYAKAQADLNAKQRAQREAEARARIANVQTPSTVEQADQTMYSMFPSLGLYKKPEPLAERQPTPYMQREQFDRKRMQNGTWQYGPMVGTQGMPTPVPETQEQRRERRLAEMREITPALKARLRERAIERAQTGQNADMTRYHPVTNPQGRIVTTGQYREDGTEMLKDRITNAPYYQAPTPNPVAPDPSNIVTRGLPAPPVGSADWSVGTQSQYSAPVDPQAAAQQRFNEYLSGAADRRRRKFESGSVTGDLADEVRDEASKRIDTFASEQLDEAGQQIYGRLSARLQQINNSKVRPSQKSRALRQWMDEFDSAGLGRHVVHTPTTRELYDDTYTDPKGNVWGKEKRNDAYNLKILAEAQQPEKAQKAEPPKVGEASFDDLSGADQYRMANEKRKELENRRKEEADFTESGKYEPVGIEEAWNAAKDEYNQAFIGRTVSGLKSAVASGNTETVASMAQQLMNLAANDPSLKANPEVQAEVAKAVQYLKSIGGK